MTDVDMYSPQPLAPLILAADAARPRSTQKKLGASDVAGCRRKAAYKLHGVEPSDPVGEGMIQRAAIGTLIHDAALPLLAAAYGGLHEVGLEDEHVRSSADLYLPDRFTLEDVKTRDNEYGGFDRAVQYGPRHSELLQVHGYADLLEAGAIAADETRLNGPQAVTDYRIRFINRGTGDEHVWPEQGSAPVDPDLIAEFRDRRDEILAAKAPEDVVRDEKGPGLSFVCDSCVFRTECWGTAREGRLPQSILIHDDADIAQAGLEYREAADVIKDATAVKDFARAKLYGVAKPGRYGRVKVRYSKPGADGEIPDMDEIRERYDELREDVPMKVKPGAAPKMYVDWATE